MLNPQQPFGADVITRISATMMDPQALDQLTALARQGLHQLATEVCADGGVELTEVYEVALAGNATMTHIALGIDPESLGVAPFVMTSRIFDAVLAARHRRRRAPRRARLPVPRRWAPTWAGTSCPARWPRGWTATSARGCSSTWARTARSCSRTPTGCWPPRRPAGPAFEGAAIRCGMRAAPRRHRRRQDQRRGREPAGDRRRRARRALRLRPGRRRRRAGAGQAAGRVRPAAGRRDRRADPSRAGRAAAQGRRRACLRAALARRAAATWPTRSTCPSATCASCSSPRPPSPPAGGC